MLDVDKQGYLTVETFKNIFEKLNLGTIEPNEEQIFKEVADFDKDDRISLEDFRKILTYNTGEDEEGFDPNSQQQQLMQMEEMEMDDQEEMEDDMQSEDEEEAM